MEHRREVILVGTAREGGLGAVLAAGVFVALIAVGRVRRGRTRDWRSRCDT